MRVSEIQVYVSGQSVVRRSIEAGQPFEIPLRFGSDAFVTVEVRGEADERFNIVVPRSIPFAFTNPIWIDAAGDGVWTPPGLLGTLPAGT